jgi:hypothetical protein
MLDRLIVLALAIGGAWLTWSLWNERQTYLDVEHWPTVMAEVVKLDEFEETRETKYGSKYKDYLIELEYRYQVDGQTFSGNELSASGNQMRWSSSEKMLADAAPFFFDQGQSVRVVFHPEQPATSIAIVCERSLESEPAYSWFSILICGGFTAFLSLAFLGSFVADPIQETEAEFIQSLRTSS